MKLKPNYLGAAIAGLMLVILAFSACTTVVDTSDGRGLTNPSVYVNNTTVVNNNEYRTNADRIVDRVVPVVVSPGADRVTTVNNTYVTNTNTVVYNQTTTGATSSPSDNSDNTGTLGTWAGTTGAATGANTTPTTQ